MMQRRIGVSKQPTVKECLLFLNGNGYGNSDGYGYGNGNGNGDGDGYGNGDGDGDGYGNFYLKHPFYKIDGIWCKILHIHGDYAKVAILDMYNTDNCKIAYVAKDNDMFAHGSTPKEARKSLLYKLSDRDTSPYADWKLTDIKSKKELIKAYRAITGACEFGTRQFCESFKLPNRASVAKAIELTAGQYGNETFKHFFEDKA